MLPDPVELMEMRIEELIEEQCAGVPDGFIRCYQCKAIVPDGEVSAASASPDAPAVCMECLGKIYQLDS